MDEKTIKAWAQRLGLGLDRAKDIAHVFGTYTEMIFRGILAEKTRATAKSKAAPAPAITRPAPTQHGDFGIAYKGRVTSASTTSAAQKHAAVIKALARRFGVSEAEFKAAVLRYGSISKALEARRDKAWGYDTVESSLFPTAQKGLHPLSPAAIWGYTPAQPDTVEKALAERQRAAQKAQRVYGYDTVESLFGKKRG